MIQLNIDFHVTAVTSLQITDHTRIRQSPNHILKCLKRGELFYIRIFVRLAYISYLLPSFHRELN